MFELAKCPKCKSDDYEVQYVDDCNFHGDYMTALAKARCCQCDKEFWVREYFNFDRSETV